MINSSYVFAVKVERYLSEIGREWTKEEEELIEEARKLIKEYK